jgi:hypothetical protein
MTTLNQPENIMKIISITFGLLCSFVLALSMALCYQYCWNSLIAPSGIFPSLSFNFILGFVLIHASIKVKSYFGGTIKVEDIVANNLAVLILLLVFTKLALLCNFTM